MFVWNFFDTIQTERAEPCSEGTEQTERGRGVDNREIINETLVHLFHEIQKLEEEAIITEDFKDLTNNDMHIIEAVGLEGGNMSSIAAKLDITVGSLTTSMNSLVKKGYTERERSEKDRRIVYIHLTGKGRQAFHHHAKFHEQMTDAVMAELGEEEVQVLGKTLKTLTDFFLQRIRTQSECLLISIKGVQIRQHLFPILIRPTGIFVSFQLIHISLLLDKLVVKRCKYICQRLFY